LGLAPNPDKICADAVGVRIHNFGISDSTMRVLFRFACRCKSPRTSNNFKRQSQISVAAAALRKGSNNAGVVANSPNNPSVSEMLLGCDVGMK
jgi:hypothetical protein